MRRKLIALGAVLLPCAAAGAPAQAGSGCVMPLIQAGEEADFNHAPQRAIRAQLARVHEVILAAPPVAHVTDLRLRPRASSGWDETMPFLPPPPNGPLRGYYVLSAYPPAAWEGPCGVKRGGLEDWVSQLVVAANSIGTAVWDEKMPLLQDSTGGIFAASKVTRSVGGFPMYDDRVVIVTNIRRPLVVPVSMERALRARLAEHRKAAATLQGAEREYAESSGVRSMEDALKQLEQLYEVQKTTNPTAAAELKANIDKMRQQLPTMRATVAAANRQGAENARRGGADEAEKIRRIEGRLAAMSPAERRAQAYWGGQGADEWMLNRAGAPGAVPLVALNPDFYDRSAPRTALQVVSLIPRADGRDEASLFARRVLEALDYSRIAAVLAK